MGDFERPRGPDVLTIVRGVLEVAMHTAERPEPVEDAALGYDAHIEHIRREYRGKIANARKYGNQLDRAAMVMALKIEQAARIRAVREQHAAERHQARERWKRLRPLPRPEP